MTDPLSIFTGVVSGLKGAADMAVGLSKLHTLAEVNAKAIELHQIIFQLGNRRVCGLRESFGSVD